MEIMKAFNIKEGKEIGIIKNAIKDAILDGKIKNDKEDAFAYMVKKAEKLKLFLKKWNI